VDTCQENLTDQQQQIARVEQMTDDVFKKKYSLDWDCSKIAAIK
jgi:hypothetical protein